jgi:hypothetical protein
MSFTHTIFNLRKIQAFSRTALSRKKNFSLVLVAHKFEICSLTTDGTGKLASGKQDSQWRQRCAFHMRETVTGRQYIETVKK